LGGSKEDVVKQ